MEPSLPGITAEQSAFVRRYDGMILSDWMQAYYDHSGFYNVGLWQVGIHTQAQASQRLVDSLLQRFPSHHGRILDVACGLGATTHRLLKHYLPTNIAGVNLSAQQLSVCRQRLPQSQFYQMDAANLDFPTGSFERMLCVEAAFHFHSRFRFLQAAQRVLKPGGWIALSDMLIGDPDCLGSWMIPPENQGLDLEIYRRQWQQAGFQSLHITDATECCWRPYCRRLQQALTQAVNNHQISAADWERSRRYFDRLIATNSIIYLLVSAQKPLPLGPNADR